MLFRAPCKINLTLDVFDKNQRADGYHNLDSFVLIFNEPNDELDIDIDDSANSCCSIDLKCNDSTLPVDHQNLAYRAADAYLKRTNKLCRIKIELKKSIPKEAGLGGGSSDAAAILLALNIHFGELLNQSEMIQLGARLGADVPLFLIKKPLRMRGIGELITTFDFEITDIWGVLIQPDIGVSTSCAYALLDQISNRSCGNSTETLLTSLLELQLDSRKTMVDILKQHMANDFEAAIFPAYPEIANAYQILIDAGVVRALLCGSGSCLFGLARNKEHAVMLHDKLLDFFSFVKVVTNKK